MKVGPAEITAIAGFLSLPETVFLERYTRLRTDRAGLSLVEQEDDSCIFLSGNDCLINEVKPQQCRDFPNKWNFPGWRQVCHAVPVSLEPQTA